MPSEVLLHVVFVPQRTMTSVEQSGETKMDGGSVAKRLGNGSSVTPKKRWTTLRRNSVSYASSQRLDTMSDDSFESCCSSRMASKSGASRAWRTTAAASPTGTGLCSTPATHTFNNSTAYSAATPGNSLQKKAWQSSKNHYPSQLYPRPTEAS